MSIVARQYDVNTNMVFTWRKRYGDAPTSVPSPLLVPVMVTPDRVGPTPPPPTDAIEIELPSGYRVRIGFGVKAASLRLVLDALERR